MNAENRQGSMISLPASSYSISTTKRFRILPQHIFPSRHTPLVNQSGPYMLEIAGQPALNGSYILIAIFLISHRPQLQERSWINVLSSRTFMVVNKGHHISNNGKTASSEAKTLLSQRSQVSVYIRLQCRFAD